MPADGRRPRRVAERLREHLSSALVTELGDPRLLNVAVTLVELSADLGYADVRVRAFGEATPAAQKEVLHALARARGRLRRGLGPVLGLRRVPELRFHYDTGPDARARIDELLLEVERDSKAGQGSGGSGSLE
jgi:ribosome-binding factor A